MSSLNTQAEFARDLDSVLSASGAFYSHGGEFLPQEQHDAVVGVKRDAFLAKWGPFVVVERVSVLQAAAAPAAGPLTTQEPAKAPRAFETLPLATYSLDIEERAKWINVLDPLLRYAGRPGDWGYGSKLGLLTQHLLQIRQEIVQSDTAHTAVEGPAR